jgi:hypothetical protein
LSTGLTGGGDRSDRSELSCCSCSAFIKWFACIHLGGGALVQGELACVQEELFMVFEHWFDGLCSLLEHSFVSGCVEPLPLPEGSETCLLQVILLFVFLWFSFACWSFFLFVYFLFITICVCCQCTHQGGH